LWSELPAGDAQHAKPISGRATPIQRWQPKETTHTSWLQKNKNFQRHTLRKRRNKQKLLQIYEQNQPKTTKVRTYQQKHADYKFFLATWFGLTLLLVARRRVLPAVWMRNASVAPGATTTTPCVAPAPCSGPCSALAKALAIYTVEQGCSQQKHPQWDPTPLVWCSPEIWTVKLH
jgi:hypothetical protein